MTSLQIHAHERFGSIVHEILQSLSSVCPRSAILCFNSEIERDGCETETSYELAAGGTGGEGEFVGVEDVEW